MAADAGCLALWCGLLQWRRPADQQHDRRNLAKISTPAGSKLPLYCKQMPVEQDAFAN
jgi:hypothetical protein